MNRSFTVNSEIPYVVLYRDHYTSPVPGLVAGARARQRVPEPVR